MKRNILIAALILSVVLSAAILAQRPGKGKRDGRSGRALAALNLTDAQQAQITTLRLTHQKEMMPLRDQMHAHQNKIKLAMTGDQFNQADVKKLLTDAEKLRSEMHMKRILHKRQVRDLLTDSQKEQFDLMTLHEGRRGQRGFGRSGGWQGRGNCDGSGPHGRGFRGGGSGFNGDGQQG